MTRLCAAIAAIARARFCNCCNCKSLHILAAFIFQCPKPCTISLGSCNCSNCSNFACNSRNCGNFCTLYISFPLPGLSLWPYDKARCCNCSNCRNCKSLVILAHFIYQCPKLVTVCLGSCNCSNCARNSRNCDNSCTFSAFQIYQ